MTTSELPVTPQSHDPTILVADDDPTNLSTLSNYLKSIGFRVTEAHDGESALAEAEHGHPDLILMSLLMPNLNGVETCRSIKARETLRDIPVIFMTGQTETGDRAKGFEAGGEDYIVKPVQQEEVLARIKMHLDLHMAQKQLEVQNARLQEEISSRERIEEILREGRLELNEAQRLGRMGSWVWDPGPDQVTWSKELYRIFGCDPALPAPNFQGHKKFFTAEGWKQLSVAVERALQTGVPYQLDLEMIRADGQRAWITARGEAQRDAAGRIAKLRGTIQDITERKRAEEELQWKTAFLEAQVLHSNDGILVVDSQGKKILQNQRTADLWGLPPSISSDLGDAQQVHYVTNQVKDSERFIERVKYLYAHPDEVSCDEIELKNGKVLDRYSSPVIDNNGKYYGRIWSFHEVTGRKRAAEALKKAHDTLEQRVEERTAELRIANAQLLQINRTLLVLSECNQQVVHATEENELLHKICHIIVGPGGYPSVWIGFAEDNPDKSVRPVAQEGFEEWYSGTLNISWADTALGRGPTGTAIRTGRPSIINNIQTSIDFAPWREDAMRRGYASVIGLPLQSHGWVFGSLTIYAGVPDAFPPGEVDVLKELAGDLAYGIMSLRAQSERRKAEEELRRLASLQSAILNNTIYTVISTDENGVITSINPAGERCLGYTAAECIGKLKPTLFHDPGEMAERARIFSKELGMPIQPGFEVFAARARRGLPNEYEWTYVRKDGFRFPVLLSVTALRDSAGNIIGFIGLANDIAERKRAEEALRESQRELTKAQHVAKMGSWVWEPEHDVVTWSKELYEIFAIDPALPAPSYRDLESLCTPTSWKHLSAAVEQALQDGKPYEHDVEIVRRDGRRGWFTTRGEGQRDTSGRIIKLRGTAQDITERKLAEEALYRSEQKFMTIFRSSPVALSVSELETGRFVEINEAMLRLMHGRSVDQLVGHTSLETGVLRLEQRKKMVDAMLRTDHVDRLEIEAHRLDGEPIMAEVSLSRYELEGKWYLLTNIVDITERNLAREEIQRLNTDLERRVAERTSELAAANRELETFNYSVSHDLRAPLRAIDGFSRLLMEDHAAQLGSEASDYLDHICEAAERINQLITGLLNLSRITRTPIHFQQVDLSAMVHAIAAELHELEPRRDIQFVIAPELCSEGDPDLLRVVLQNLVGNAWKYTGKHPRARIEFGAEKVDGETVFYVRDDGAGFDPEKIGKLFNPFQRLHEPNEFPGTGIGLTIVQRIIQRHGGRIWAEGAVNKGATFRFTIPPQKKS